VALNALPAPDHKHAVVRTMFDRIAPRYDRMNRLLTIGLDQRWRRAALETIGVGAGDRVLDLAAGTGDLAQLARARGARVIAEVRRHFGRVRHRIRELQEAVRVVEVALEDATCCVCVAV